MTDTAIALTAATAGAAGPQTVTASADLYTANDVGRLLSLKTTAEARTADHTYAVGVIFFSTYAGVDRLYRVIASGTSAAASMAGTTPDYDLNAPREADSTLADGSAILKYLGQGRQAWGYGTITAVADPTHATVDVALKGPFAGTDGSTRWRLGEWSDTRGWPQAIAKWKGRLWFFGSGGSPDTVWSSEAGDYESMSPCEPDGTVLDTNGITETMDADQVAQGLWLAPGPRGMLAGTAGGEFLIKPGNANAALSATNVEADPVQDRGSSANVAGQAIAGVCLFIDASGRKLIEVAYDLATDSFSALELTELADHMTSVGIVEAAYQVTENLWWGLRSDGKLATLTYDRWQKVRAWSLHELGGTNARAISLCIVPNPAGDGEDVYVAVERTVNGATMRTIEVIPRPFRADIDGDTGFSLVDSAVAYSGAPHITFTGLGHLEGETVLPIADGSARVPRVVSGGAITISGAAASSVVVGLQYDSHILDLPPDAPAAPGFSARGQTKRVNEVSLLLLETIGGIVGEGGDAQAITTRTEADPMGAAVPLFTGSVKVSDYPGDFDPEGQLRITASPGMPLTVLGIVKSLASND